MMLRRLVVSIGAASILLVSVSGGAGQTTLRMSIAADARGTSPGVSTDDITSIVNQHMFEGLVAYREDGTVANLLAERIDVSADGRAYTVTLRSGVTFHNNAPLRADDVVWAWRRYLDPAAGWPCRVHFDGRRHIKIEAVEAVDPMRVRFTLQAPNALFLSMLARSDCDGTGIAHRDSVNADGSWRHPVGTGPFKLAQWRKGEFIELSRFEGYAPAKGRRDGYAGDKRPLVDAVRFVIVPDPAAAKAALLAGQLDIWYGVPPHMKADLARAPGIKVYESPTTSMLAIPMQTGDPVLKDARVRRAINMALDFPQLVDALHLGPGKPNHSPISPSSAHFGPVQRQGHVHDVAAAKRLLAEAGYRGEPITLVTNRTFSTMHDVGVLLQAMLQPAGINLQLEILDWTAQLDRYNSGKYQLITFFYTPQLDPAMQFDRFIGSKQKERNKVWDSPEAEELVRRLMLTSGTAERQALFDDLHRRFIADAPMININSGVAVSAALAKVKGFDSWPGRKARLWGVRLD